MTKTFMIFDGYEKSLLSPFPCIEATTGKQAIKKLIEEREYTIKDVIRDGGRDSRFSATPVVPSKQFPGMWSRVGRTIWYKPVSNKEFQYDNVRRLIEV